MNKPTQAQIDQFLSVKRLALIGVSRNEKQYSRMLFRELIKQGYETLPVNPTATELDGQVCYKSVIDIVPLPVRAVIVLPKDKTLDAVLECAKAGIKDVWVLPITDCDPTICEIAKAKGMNLISGVCLFMFLPNAGWIHRLHGRILKLLGAYPK